MLYFILFYTILNVLNLLSIIGKLSNNKYPEERGPTTLQNAMSMFLLCVIIGAWGIFLLWRNWNA